MNNTTKPNILFLLVDSLRSDKCYGQKKTSITPNLDNLIKKGVCFTQTVSSTPAYMESIANWTKSTRTSDDIGIGYNQYKYFRSRDDKQKNIGLFNLNDDPLEEINLAKEYPEKIIEMEKILSSIISNNDELKIESNEFRDLDEEKLVEAELKKLGYL